MKQSSYSWYSQYRQKRQHGTAEFPVAYFYSPFILPNDAIPLHWHPECELVHVISGSMQLSVNGTLYELSDHTFYFLYGEVLHSAETANCLYETIVFSAERLFEQWPLCPEKRCLLETRELTVRPNLSQKPCLHKICETLFALLHGSLSFPALRLKPPMAKESDYDPGYDIAILQNESLPAGYQFQVIGLLYQLFGLLFAEDYFEKPEDTAFSWNSSQKIKNTLLYIEEHFSEPISLDQLARAAGLNAKYLCRFFKAATLYTPMEYVNRYRIDHACHLLASTKESITQIALLCGFHDTSYFIRLFRRYKGTTPSRYL